jgi:hypothetical protein
MYETYGKQAEFFVVYIREAHASDGARPMKNDPISRKTLTPKTLDQRQEVASVCVKDLKIEIPCLIDDMKDTTEKAYSGWPDRMFVVAVDGTLAYCGGPGPQGFKPEEAEKALKEILKKK